MNDYTFKTSVDTVGNQYVTLRGAYEHTNRIGAGFRKRPSKKVAPGWPAVLGRSGPSAEQGHTARRADADQHPRLHCVPCPKARTSTTVKDTSLVCSTTRTPTTRSRSASPNDAVDFGASYGRDRVVTDQKSRNANPPPDASWTDPTRDWTVKNELVNNVDIYLNLPKLIEKTTVKFNYDYADSDNGYLFGGPRIHRTRRTRPVHSAARMSPTRGGKRPPICNTTCRRRSAWRWPTGTKFDVNDYATINLTSGQPRIDYLGSISTGHGNRP